MSAKMYNLNLTLSYEVLMAEMNRIMVQIKSFRKPENLKKLEGFPYQNWLKVLKWMTEINEETRQYFVAVMARDLGLTEDELKELKLLGISIWTHYFAYHRQLSGFYRRLQKPRLSQGEVQLLKREADRLGLMEPVVDLMYTNLYRQEVFEVAVFLQDLDLSKMNGRFVGVPNDPENVLHPKDREILQCEGQKDFPLKDWQTIIEWALHLPGTSIRCPVVQVLGTVAKLFRFSHLHQIYYNRHIWSRTFPDYKQGNEAERRFRKQEIRPRTVQMLNNQCYRLDVSQPFASYLGVKCREVGPNALIFLEDEKNTFKQRMPVVCDPQSDSTDQFLDENLEDLSALDYSDAQENISKVEIWGVETKPEFFEPFSIGGGLTMGEILQKVKEHNS